MRRTSLACTLACALFAACSEPELVELTPAPIPSPAGGEILPATMTDAEKLGKADGFDPRDDHPEQYGFTAAPPFSVVLPGEFEPVSTLLLGWGSGAFELGDFFLGLAQAGAEQTSVSILVASQGEANEIQAALAARGANTAAIDFSLLPLDTIWMRDYGPLVVRGPSSPMVIDGRYFWGRWNDDFAPTAIAGNLGMAVSRPQIEIEGGNLLSDGTGRCVTTSRLVENNASFGYDEQAVRDILASYYGCETTVIVPPMLGEGTGHVDMSVHITAPGKVLVGQYDSSDLINAERLDTAASLLAGAGFAVTRIPMPSNDGRTVFRSYTNALAVNDSVLVPVYDEDADHEATALALFQDAYPGRSIVRVLSDGIIQMSGAVHCVTMTISP